MNTNATPTHRCQVCGALWIHWAEGFWTLLSPSCGPCCDNTPIGDHIEQIHDDQKAARG